jgi:hypothetical protein
MIIDEHGVHHVYDEYAERDLRPPRVPSRVEAFLRSLPRGIWPFVLLAVFEAALLKHDYGFDLRAIALFALPALLPAAVLIGRHDAWSSARLILLGAILWGALPSLLLSLGELNMRLFVSFGIDVPGLAQILSDVNRLGGIVSIAGPALVAVGLYRRRRTEATWPLPLVALAVLGVAVLSVHIGLRANDMYGSYMSGPYADPSYVRSIGDQISDVIGVATMAAAPFYLLTLGALAWSALSAIRTDEAPRLFWRFVGAGSVLLLAVALWSYRGEVLGWGTAYGPDAATDFLNSVDRFLRVVEVHAYVLVMIGFGLGLPYSDEELLGDVMPEPEPDAEAAAAPA